MSSGVSVVIPSTGSLNNLKKLIPSVLMQEGLSGLQVLVVFNGLGEKAYEDLKERFEQEWPGVETIYLNDKGVNKARNAGLNKAVRPLVVFLDDDCELHQKSILKRYEELLMAYPDYFAIGGGYVLPERHGLFDEVYNYIQMNWFVCGQKNSSGLVTETQYLLGGNFCLRRDLSVQNQLQFEPGIQYGGSELDYFRKAVRAGLKLGAVEMDVTHNTKESFFSVGKKVFKQGKGKHFIDAKFGNDYLVSQASGGRYLLIRRLFSYWFWAGYYSASGKSWKLLTHILKDVIGYLDVLRFNILKKLNR